MSYCVNCGVELDNSASACALCGTKVVNPAALSKTASPTPFPELIVLPEDKKRTFRAMLLSVILLLPTPVCLIINAFLNPDTPWSAYVAASSIVVWIVCIFPFTLKKMRPYLLLGLDAAIFAGYAFTFYTLVYSGSWFFTLFLPLDALFVLTGAFLIRYFRGKKHTTVHAVTVILCAIAFFAGGTEIIFRISLPNLLTDCITLCIAVCAVILALLMMVADNNKHLKAWLTRKFYI